MAADKSTTFPCFPSCGFTFLQSGGFDFFLSMSEKSIDRFIFAVIYLHPNVYLLVQSVVRFKSAAAGEFFFLIFPDIKIANKLVVCPSVRVQTTKR